MSLWNDNKEIAIFREYLRIPSVHPNVDYSPCVSFLQKQARNLGLAANVYYPSISTKPVVVITWRGQQPGLPTIMLNSHMDVVPVFPEQWTRPPFGAEMDAEGRIYARGSQDMKCVGMQYLAAIRALKTDGITLKRTIHVVFVPDEEIGGALGMRAFVKTDNFKNLKVGFSLDEGIATPHEVYSVFYAERTMWHIHFIIHGTAGHGSLLHENTVGEKLHYLLNKMHDFRQQEVKRMESDSSLSMGDVTTVNLTAISGGVHSNVVPAELRVVFDVRVAIDVDHNAFEAQIRNWCKEAGDDIDLEFEIKEPQVPSTKLDSSNPYWLAFKRAVDELDLNIHTLAFPAGTDSCYLREIGIPALGFSPMNHTPVLLHDNDEFIKAQTYLQGIEIYKKIITAIGNV